MCNYEEARCGEHRPLISELEEQRQADLCGFEASLVYIVSFGPSRATVPQKNKFVCEKSKPRRALVV